MSDLVVVGMAYFDVFVPPHRPVQPGEELFVEGIHLALGGALNTASVAAALGLRVTLCVPMGEGIVDQAVRLLTERLNMTLVPLAAPDNPAISLVFSSTSDRSFVSTAKLDVLAGIKRLPAGSWIHVPGLEEADRLAAPLATARADGARISVSGSWSPTQLARLAGYRDQPWDVLVLNEKEALTACTDIVDINQVPQKLAGAARNVIVTQGSNGAFGSFDGAAVQVPVGALQAIKAVDTTGAGDAFCGGLISALLLGAPPAAALEHGTRAAAKILCQVGGVVTDLTMMNELKEQRWTA
jgi:sugar/nucleoside kinase (ribokinase family)